MIMVVITDFISVEECDKTNILWTYLVDYGECMVTVVYSGGRWYACLEVDVMIWYASLSNLFTLPENTKNAFPIP